MKACQERIGNLISMQICFVVLRSADVLEMMKMVTKKFSR